jgi:hypothetical protein
VAEAGPPGRLTAALLDNQPLGFHPPEVLARDARRHGVSFLVDINRSAARCTLAGDPPAVRLGLAPRALEGWSWCVEPGEAWSGSPHGRGATQTASRQVWKRARMISR